MLADDWNRLCGSDVVARRPVIVVGKNVEVFGDDLLTARESETAAHRVIMPDRMGVHEGGAVVASSADNVCLAGITLS
jgi:hypothetical protein